MKRTVVFLSMILLLTYCKSTIDEPNIPIDKVISYFPLSVGNYWVYKIYDADSTLNFKDQNQIDSIYVQKDSLVNGNVYKVVRSSLLAQTWLLRDSSNYIVMHDGKKLLTTNNTGEILYWEHYNAMGLTFSLSYKMKSSDSVSNVPLGNFPSKYVVGTLVCDTANPQYKDRKVFSAYTKNIGLVCKRMAFLISKDYLEERLIRYKVIN
ncbi:MAG: hypothetical protein AB1775_10025 [Bacteroidota bacterium]